jgi:hypothetical protein
MNDEVKNFLLGLAKHLAIATVDYTVANLDQLNFGQSDMLIKTVVRLALIKLQNRLNSPNFKFSDVLDEINSLVG